MGTETTTEGHCLLACSAPFAYSPCSPSQESLQWVGSSSINYQVTNCLKDTQNFMEKKFLKYDALFPGLFVCVKSVKIIQHIQKFTKGKKKAKNILNPKIEEWVPEAAAEEENKQCHMGQLYMRNKLKINVLLCVASHIHTHTHTCIMYYITNNCRQSPK